MYRRSNAIKGDVSTPFYDEWKEKQSLKEQKPQNQKKSEPKKETEEIKSGAAASTEESVCIKTIIKYYKEKLGLDVNWEYAQDLWQRGGMKFVEKLLFKGKKPERSYNCDLPIHGLPKRYVPQTQTSELICSFDNI